MIPPREETSCGRRSPPVGAMNTDDGTIRTFGGKARCKSPYLARQLLVFFALAIYMVVKITCSCFEVVLQTMKNYKSHYSLS
jgi:hypothetical protein